jgi:Dolichyl-phosphate-mannose-protein mannosyltransferase
MTVRHSLVVLAAILLVGVLLRCVNLWSPFVLDAHAFRQGDTAAFADGYLTGSASPVNPTILRNPCSRYDRFGHVESELPLPSWLAAMPLWVLGQSHAPAPYLRIVWLVYFVVGGAYLYRLTRELGEGETVALLTVATYSVLPLGVFFTKSIQPDGPSLAVAFAFLFYLTRWLSTRGRADEVLVLGLGALLLAMKLPNAYVGAPAAYLIWERDGLRKLVRSPRYWLWVAAVCSVPIAWSLKTHAEAGWSFGIWGRDTKWTDIGQWFDAPTWLRLGRRLVTQIVTWSGLALGLLGGFVAARESRAVRVGIAWLAGFGVFVLIALPAHNVHVYYQLPLIVPAALAIPHGILFLARRGWAGRAALAASLVWFSFTTHTALAASSDGFFKEDNNLRAGSELVRRVVPKRERILVVPSVPAIYYNAARSGFMLSRKGLQPNRIRQCMTSGEADYLVLSPKETKRFNALRSKDKELQSAFRRIGRRAGWTVFEKEGARRGARKPKRSRKG